jgi:FKBP-type peptidyl-prolyl cis-trans isomerase FkpA
MVFGIFDLYKLIKVNIMKYFMVVFTTLIMITFSMNAKAITTKSGLTYEVLQQGTGKKPSANSTVMVFYKGGLANGFIFDRTERNKPFSFRLNAVIRGWTEGVQLMNEGSVYKFTIPPELAYGSRGAGAIPPNSTLTFVIQLLSVR